ncbi:ABC transporter substrate-binding protein [Caballeronia sp. J97]|uniref:ABC transporter substrate-binding protein n=1 Tax=Caballeronia sp. J97 TaxID=2805429 RepID=UPI002AB1B3F1|nr:ABC transporter substrate-binding protein [Caballeronia sp. J97]
MNTNDFKVSRRQFLAMAAAGGASLALPRAALSKAGDHLTMLMGSGGPLLAWAPHFLAETMGYYKDEGLTLERIYTRSGPAGMTALVSGAGNAYYTAPGELLAATARGQKFKILMAQSAFNELYFMVSPSYAAKHSITGDSTPLGQRLSTVKNFKGLRCGVTSPGSITDYCARQVLAQSGLDPASDATIVPLQSTSNMIAAMANGTIDAMVATPPVTSIAAARVGAVFFLSVSKDEISGFKSLAGHLIEARVADVEQNPDLYAAIVRADTRGLRYVIENKKEAGEALYKAQFSSTVEPTVWASVWEQNWSQFKSPYVTRQSLEAWVTMKLVPGVSDPKALHLDEVLDMRFVDQAVKKIGWKASA